MRLNPEPALLITQFFALVVIIAGPDEIRTHRKESQINKHSPT